VLRLLIATVEHWRDVSVGFTVVLQAVETLRKIRNTARFLLGNIGKEKSSSSLEQASGAGLGLVCLVSAVRSAIDELIYRGWQAERYVMHELYRLEDTALQGYRSYNFPQGAAFSRLHHGVCH
jgi:isoleucyl-tRNA synthetase